MITLTKRLRAEAEGASSASGSASGSSNAQKRASIRDKLLVKEVQEMEQTLPPGCKVRFEDPNVLHEFTLTVVPDEHSYWHAGKFRFRIAVEEDYNLSPPTVRCLTRLWHPNISETGEVCLSILRLSNPALGDGFGWTPTRRLRDVIMGLASLFGDLLNFEDPLNHEAAEHFIKDKEGFKTKVKDYVSRYARR